jgi:hypothetical protein
VRADVARARCCIEKQKKTPGNLDQIESSQMPIVDSITIRITSDNAAAPPPVMGVGTDSMRDRAVVL